MKNSETFSPANSFSGDSLRKQALKLLPALAFSVLVEGCIPKEVPLVRDEIQLKLRSLDPKTDAFFEKHQRSILGNGEIHQKHRSSAKDSPVFDLSEPVQQPSLQPELQANLETYKILVDSIEHLPETDRMAFAERLIALFWKDRSSYTLMQEAPLLLSQNLRSIYREVPELFEAYDQILKHPPTPPKKVSDYSASSPYGHYLAIIKFIVASFPFEIYANDECETLFLPEISLTEGEQDGFIRLYQLYYHYGVDDRFEREIEGVDPEE